MDNNLGANQKNIRRDSLMRSTNFKRQIIGEQGKESE
jgi:hypothetical protein